MPRLALILSLCGAAPALAQSYNNNLNPLGGPAQLQVNMNPNWTPALGDGRGLERDFSGMGLGNYNARDFTGDLRIRNNIVSSNAFSTGYGYSGFNANTARSYNFGANRLGANVNRSYDLGAQGFQGTMASGNLFSFRRDAIGSGAAGLGVRGTESLQYLYGYSTANKFAIPSARPVSPISPGTPQGAILQPISPMSWEYTAPSSITVDEFSTLGGGWSDVAPKLGTLRSTSSFLSSRELNASVIGGPRDQSGRQQGAFMASPMLGLQLAPGANDRIDLAVPESRAPQSVNRAIDPTTGKPVPDPLAKPADAKPDGVNPAEPLVKTDAEYRTAYDEVLDRFAKADGIKPLPDTKPDDLTPLWKARLNKLKEQMEAMDASRERTAVNPSSKPADAKESAEKRREASKLFDLDTLKLIKEAGGQVKSYAKLSGHEREMYARFMSEGAKALADKRYFDAEEQFVRCLDVAPGDPTVSAARINAQLGAALFLSAAINAKALFDSHPEVIGVRYTEGTLPGPDRLKTVAGLLRDRVAESRRVKEPPPRHAAFLLAYIGYQTGDAAMTREGLDLLDETYADHPEPLVPIIRGVWLEEK